MDNVQIKTAVESMLNNEIIARLNRSLDELNGARDMFPSSDIDSEIDTVNSKISAIKSGNVHYEFFADAATQIPNMGKSANYDSMVINNCYGVINNSTKWING